ncbi:hypothetical protein N7481_013070 [Penicillium waksmanii]|uniref:uncharacterized protein n=1 Tax=Penicillium waksmanii TaxID=69791 RepID=UPI00254872B7|nr:uncharacterized protein N7481_013070 [Penicillium waksmanii]KAJ5966356.1 hypothetical protein N7481_013070 [Penicillium waksmanii]
MASQDKYELEGPNRDADSFHHHGRKRSTNGFSRLSKPLINSVRNAWQSSSPAYHPLTSTNEDKHPRWVQMALSVIAAPRFRRYVIIYLTLFLLGWAGWGLVLSPHLQDRADISRALDASSRTTGWFGTNALPRFDDLTLIQTLDPKFLPGGPVDVETLGAGSRKRLVVVGDVHGCKDELSELLEKVSFSNEGGDHLIFTGDLINKGPDSNGVVDMARELSASCVRGNHEDRVLLLRKEMADTQTFAEEQDVGINLYTEKQLKERALARALSDEQAEWLGTCPVILNVGQIPTMGQVIVVHAGIVPGVELERQDPSLVMTMRTIDVDTHVPSESSEGLKWAKMFNKHQSNLEKSLSSSSEDPRSGLMTVIYGHDAKTSLKIRTYAKGLDSGCVKGGKLTALVIEDDGTQNIVQVKCRNYSKG